MPLQKIDLPKWCYVIVYLYNTPNEVRYNEKLFRILNMATSHARTILNIFLEQGYITKERNGKIKFIQLSDKGVELAQKLWPLVQEFRQLHQLSDKIESFFFPGQFIKHEKPK